MEYTVLIQSKRGGGFKATIPALPKCQSTGATEDEAIANLRTVLSKFLKKTKVTSIQVDENGQQQNDPWLAMAGMWRDDPTWDEYQRLIKKYRRRPRARK
jgi:predicted RNase H-like HicB family nuclease